MGTLKNLSLFILHPAGFFQGPPSEPGLILMALGSCPVVTLPQLQSLACLPDTVGEQPYVSHDYGEAHSFLQTFTKRNPDPRHRLKNRSQQDGPRFQPWFHPYIQDDTHLAFECIYLLPFLRLLLLPSTIPLLRIKTWYQHHLD